LIDKVKITGDNKHVPQKTAFILTDVRQILRKTGRK